jgi:hypothetical protein
MKFLLDPRNLALHQDSALPQRASYAVASRALPKPIAPR